MLATACAASPGLVRAADCIDFVAPQRAGSIGDDEVLDVAAVDADRYVIVGYERGTLGVADWPVGDSVAFVEVRRHDGQLEWRQVLDSAGTDIADAVAVESDGTIVVAGRTSGSLPGGVPRGGMDGFLAVYDPQGLRLGLVQFGDERPQHPKAIAILPDQIAVVGYDDAHIVDRAVQDWENATVTRFAKPSPGALAWVSHWRSAIAAPDVFVGAAVTQDGRLLLLDRQETSRGGLFVREWGDDEREIRSITVSPVAMLDFAERIEVHGDQAFVMGNSASGLGGAARGHSEGFVMALDIANGALARHWTTQVPSEHLVMGGSGYVADGQIVYVSSVLHMDDLALMNPRTQLMVARLDLSGGLREALSTPMSDAFALGFDVGVVPVPSAMGAVPLLATSVTGALPGTPSLGAADRLLARLDAFSLYCDGFEPISMPRLPWGLP